MKKILMIYLVIFAVLITSCLATDVAYTYQPLTLWADILQQPTFYNSTWATITIISPSNTTLVYNENMTKLSTGVFYYNFTPNLTGVYYTNTLYYNGTMQVGTASSTFFVELDESMYIAVLLGLIGLIVLSFWYARTFANKPLTGVNIWILDNVTTRDFSIIFDVVGAILIMPLLALLNVWTAGTAYNPIFSAIYSAGMYVVGFAVLGYIVFYLMFRYNEGIETLGNIGDKFNGGRNNGRR